MSLPHFVTVHSNGVVRSLTSVLTSRFLISLQKCERKVVDSSSRPVTLGDSDVRFQSQTSRYINRFIGSLGAQLTLNDIDGGEGESGDEDEP